MSCCRRGFRTVNDKKIVDPAGIRRKGLSKSALLGILTQLRGWIEGIKPADTGKTVWGDYARNNTYTDAAEETKCRFIAEFAEATKPNLLWDLGCNSGNYSAVALAVGAKAAVGFDFDQKALELAYDRACTEGLNLLPLFQDAANPSPDQGGTRTSGAASTAGAEPMGCWHWRSSIIW